jgi:hypothetical protein
MTLDVSGPTPLGAGIEPAALVARLDGDDTYLMVRVGVQTDSTFSLVVIEVIEDVEVNYGSQIIATDILQHVDNAWYTLRAQTFGSQMRLRIWERGEREPIERWDLEIDYTGSLVTGGVGIRSGVSSGNTNPKPLVLSFANFEVVNGEFDDMSRQLGAWSVDHHLDDGLPDQVSFVSGTAVPELRADVIRPGWIPGRGRMTNREFFSPFNDRSPIHAFPRDVPPAMLDVGVVTEDGRDYLRLFTGQAQDFPMRGGEITLSALSATRLTLSKLVQPPAVYGLYEGANATWLVSYALATCGVYASPPPQDGCRWWAPMHGSIRSFIPATNGPQLNVGLYIPNPQDGSATTGGQHVIDEPWIEGPYVSAPNLANLTEHQAAIDTITTGTGLALADGDDFASQAGNVGKLEMWVKGVDFDNLATTVVRLFAQNTNGSKVDVGITSADRRLFVSLNDSVSGNSFQHSTPLPTDDAWHFCGFAWKVAAPTKRWINLDGVVETNNNTFQVSGYPPVDTFDLTQECPRPIFRIPVAEVQLTTGPTGNPDNFPWLRDIAFTPGAQIEPSSVNLVSIAEQKPREAWEIVSAMALAELAMLRIDEEDIVRYLGWTWWGRAAQQTVVDHLDSTHNMAAPDVNIDPTKIRNSVSATFSEGFNVNLFASALAVSDIYTIGPGISVLTLPTSIGVAELRGFDVYLIADADTVQPTDTHFVSLNSANDGTGTYATTANVSVEVTSWDPGQVTFKFTNHDGANWFTANDKSWATINAAGKLLDLEQRTITESDVDSVALRGERGMTISLTPVHRAIDARRAARRIVDTLAGPVPVIGQTAVRGDPRRQPGDLVTVTDRETGVDARRFRLQSIFHDDDGRLYTQKVTMRRALQGGRWGVDFYWGQNIWTSED